VGGLTHRGAAGFWNKLAYAKRENGSVNPTGCYRGTIAGSSSSTFVRRVCFLAEVLVAARVSGRERDRVARARRRFVARLRGDADRLRSRREVGEAIVAIRVGLRPDVVLVEGAVVVHVDVYVPIRQAGFSRVKRAVAVGVRARGTAYAGERLFPSRLPATKILSFA